MASSACVVYLYSRPLLLREVSSTGMSIESEVRGLRIDEVRRVLVLVLVLLLVVEQWT